MGSLYWSISQSVTRGNSNIPYLMLCCIRLMQLFLNDYLRFAYLNRIKIMVRGISY